MSKFLEMVRDSVLSVRSNLRNTYCIDKESGDCRGKARILKYIQDEDMEWKDVKPLVSKAINTPVVIVPPAELRSNWGIHDMGYFSKKNPPRISVVSNLPSAYHSRYGTFNGLQKFVKYTLYHEFGHALDHAVNIAWKQSQGVISSYVRDVGKIVRGGEGRESYFDIGTQYGQRELFAEWTALQDLHGPFDIGDIRALCYIKQKYPKGDRVKWLASKGYEVTEQDHVAQSKLIQSFLNCSDHEETLKRLTSMGIKTK